MSFSDLASLGAFVSALGVLASLVYLSLQIRQNTHALRSQIHQGMTESWLNLAMVVNPHAREFATGLVSNEQTFAAMNDAEKYVFMSSIFVFFKHFENIYLQCQEGLIPRQNWDAWARLMFMYWRMPGVQHWWRSRRETFSPAFREFIENSPTPTLPMTTDFFGNRSHDR